ncbi:MAG: winged helix-turn-helix transcriptional regulator [Candidatus Pacebacteria bacterium]|nr:winged helix-turn-helix transcriptional regulator [Candidatus Paceibacterota bacterium]
MVQQSKFFYPLGKETIEDLVKLVFEPIKRGESVTMIWVPMAGRRVVTKFVIENINLFPKIISNFNDYLLVYIEPLELIEESARGYFRLVGKSLVDACLTREECRGVISEKDLKVFEGDKLSYARLLSKVNELVKKVADCGLEIVFFLGEFDELDFADGVFYNNLKFLWLKFAPLVHFVFLNREEIVDLDKIARYKDLNELLLQNVLYIPIFRKEIDYLIDRITSRFKRKFSDKEKNLIKASCGPHPYSIVVAARTIALFNGKKVGLDKLKKQILAHYELNAVSGGVLEVLSDEARSLLRRIAAGDRVEEETSLENHLLSKLGLIYKAEDGRWRLYGEVFEQVCLGKKEVVMTAGSSQDLTYSPERGAILFRGQPVEEKFTTQEYNVLMFFLKAPGVLKTRDNLGEVLWGEDSYDKYSDWAIDQLISKLRKRLIKVGSASRIVTLRGRGYKFIAANS